MDPSLLPQSLLSNDIDYQASSKQLDAGQTPTSGMEYLRKVREEARKCAEIVVSDIDVTMFKNKQTVTVSSSNGLEAAPTGLAPSVEWQRYQTVLFSNLRQKLSRHQARQKNDTCEESSLPHVSEEESWCKLCFGDMFNERRYRRKQQDDNDDMQIDDQITNVGIPPLLSVITELDQTTVCQLLAYHIKWLNIMGFSTEQGRWIYALLVRLEKPVLADSVSWLRTLARRCAVIRATVDCKEDERLSQLNLLICLVANYFDQTDLVDAQDGQEL